VLAEGMLDDDTALPPVPRPPAVAAEALAAAATPGEVLDDAVVWDELLPLAAVLLAAFFESAAAWLLSVFCREKPLSFVPGSKWWEAAYHIMPTQNVNRTMPKAAVVYLRCGNIFSVNVRCMPVAAV
jgi:hypothetical protein